MCNDKEFGGVIVIMVGDLEQLSPVGGNILCSDIGRDDKLYGAAKHKQFDDVMALDKKIY